MAAIIVSLFEATGRPSTRRFQTFELGRIGQAESGGIGAGAAVGLGGGVGLAVGRAVGDVVGFVVGGAVGAGDGACVRVTALGDPVGAAVATATDPSEGTAWELRRFVGDGGDGAVTHADSSRAVIRANEAPRCAGDDTA